MSKRDLPAWALDESGEPIVGRRISVVGSRNLWALYDSKLNVTFYHRRRVKGKDTYHKLDGVTTVDKAEAAQDEKFPRGRKVKVAKVNEVFSDEIWEQFVLTYPNLGTREVYRGTWTRYLKKELDGVRIAGMDTDDVVALMRRLEGKGYSSSILTKCQSHLSAFFRVACDADFGYATSNPVRDLPEREKLLFETAKPVTVDDILSESEVAALVAAALEMQSSNAVKYATMFEVAPDLGLRIGELLAVRWDLIDFETRELQVEWQIAEEGYSYLDPTTWLIPPKNSRFRKGVCVFHKRRTITISRRAIETLKTYRKWALAHGLYQADGFVFPNNSMRPLNRRDVWDALKTAKERAGIEREVRFHFFRHTCASRLFARLHTYGEVAMFLGDSEKTVETTYVKFIDTQARVRRFDELEDAHLARMEAAQ